MSPIYNPYIGRQNRPIIKIQRAVSTLVNSDNCGLLPAELLIFYYYGSIPCKRVSVLLFFALTLYCCCCRGFYCLQLFVFVCRREKIFVKSNKIFSILYIFAVRSKYIKSICLCLTLSNEEDLFRLHIYL